MCCRNHWKRKKRRQTPPLLPRSRSRRKRRSLLTGRLMKASSLNPSVSTTNVCALYLCAELRSSLIPHCAWLPKLVHNSAGPKESCTVTYLGSKTFESFPIKYFSAKKSLRNSTATKTAELEKRQKDREAQEKRLKEIAQRKNVSDVRRLTQEELLEEAKHTERINLKSLGKNAPR